MKKIQLLKTISLLLIVSLFSTVLSAQGVTTASINGTVKDTGGETLIGASVIAIHVPSGSQYGTVTRVDGGYTLPAMRVGGPYTITTSYVGFQDKVEENIYLSLGQEFSLNTKLSDTSVELEGVTVVAQKAGVLNSEQTGAETRIGEEVISSVPTVNRDFNDFIKLTPQATTTADGGISIAGTNNRYNSIFIDGAVNNDVFGLSDQGTNGGQTGITPISIDAIQEFQVVLAPYDVRLGGFAGGGINAVTRSGSNKFEGSAYFFTKNENFVGKTHRYIFDPEKELSDASLDSLRTKVDDFSANTYGVRLGGPIIKNKVFFFVNAELQRDQTPQPFDFSNYEGTSSEADLNSLADYINSNYGYDAGGFLNNTRELQGEKILARLDFNLGNTTKLKVRHSYTRGTSIGPSRSSNRTINFYNGGVLFPSTTNSTAVELNSVFGSSASNDLIIGFTSVFDDRDPMGTDFPRLTINDGSGQIRLGSEVFSTANQLKNKTFTLTDNFSLYKGKHTLTFGTHNEFYNIYNLFIRQNFGEYEFGSVNDFITGAPPVDYVSSYSLVDDLRGDGSEAGASFNALQLGFYAQDRFAVSERLKLTYGLRLDIPLFLDNPVADDNFNQNTLPAIRTAYAGETEILDALDGAEAGQLPQASLMLSPRIGFNYDLKGDKATVIRGGLGVFTSRVPFVWPGGSFANNGLTVGGTFYNGFDSTFVFNPDIASQPQATDFGAEDAVPSGQIDFFSKDFKYPQVFRANIGVDQKLPGGFIGGFEAIYTKTLNNVVYYNLNIKPSSESLSGADARPLFDRFDPVDDTYTRIILGDNTNKGYGYNLTMRLDKPFDNGLLASLSYSLGDAWAINDGTSSQNSSQWRYMENSGGRNYLNLSRSDFSAGLRFNGLLSYQKDFNDFLGLTASVFYEGRSGRPYSYIYNGRVSNGDSSWEDLIFIPADASQINLADPADWEALDAFIRNDKYLSANRGQFAERNGARLPFEHNFDVKLALNVGAKVSETTNKVQVSLDILNFGNLLNSSWGAKYFARNDAVNIINLEDIDNVAGENIATYSFNAPNGDVWNVDDFVSRWRMVLGVRYIFE